MTPYVLVVTLYLMGADGLSHPGPSRLQWQPSQARCYEVRKQVVDAADRKHLQYTVGCRPWKQGDPVKGDPA